MKKAFVIIVILIFCATGSYAKKVKFPAEFSVSEQSSGNFNYQIAFLNSGSFSLAAVEFYKDQQLGKEVLFNAEFKAGTSKEGQYRTRNSYASADKIVFTLCREYQGQKSYTDRVYFIENGQAVRTRPVAKTRVRKPAGKVIGNRIQYAIGAAVTVKGFLKVLRKDGEVSTVYDSVVEAYDEDQGDSSTTQLVTTPAQVKTDLNGYFEFQITNTDPSEPGTGVDLVLKFITTNADNVNLYVPEGLVHYEYTHSTLLDIGDPGNETDTGTIQVNGSAGSPDYVIASALNVFSVTAKSARFYSVASGIDTSPLTVYWAIGYLDGDVSHYENNILRIEGYADDPDEWDDGIIAHEFGHFVYDNIATDTTFPGAYGAHSINEPSLSSNAIAANMAWSEGWAHFYAISVLGTSTYADTNDTSSNVYEFENIGNIKGPVIERVVTAVLHDMYDAANEVGDSDTLTVAFSRFINVIKNFDPNPSNDNHDNIWSLIEFWIGWQSYDGNDMEAAADIFKAHGVIVPLSPYYSGAVTTVNPELQFTLPAGSTVEVQYSVNSDFTANVNKVTGVSTDRVTLSGLESGTKYYWRVIGQTQDGVLFDTAMHEEYPDTGWNDDTPIQKPDAITSFTPSGGILDSSTVLLVDISSVENAETPGKLDLLKRTLKAFADSSNERDEISIILFEKSNTVELLPLTKLANNRANISNTIDTIVLSGNPERNFNLGLTKAYDACKLISSSNRNIVMISSGMSDGNSFLGVLAQLINDNIKVHTVFDSTGSLPANRGNAWNELKNIAVSTGGVYRYAAADSLFLAAFSLSSFLRYSTSELSQFDGVTDGGSAEFQVAVESNCSLLRFYLADSTGGEFTLKATSPGGKVYEELSGFPELTVRTADSSYYVFQLESSITPGTWTLEISNTSNGNGVKTYGIFVEAQYTDSNVATFIENHVSIVNQNSALFIKFFGTKSGQNFQGITGTYLDPSAGSFTEISPNDSGSGSDVKYADGIYTADLVFGVSGAYPVLVHDKSGMDSILPTSVVSYTVFENAASDFSNSVFINVSGISPSPFENSYITEVKPLIIVPFSGNSNAAYNIEFDFTSDNYGKTTLKNEPVVLNRNVFEYQFLTSLKEEVYLFRFKANPEIKWPLKVSADSPYCEDQSPENDSVVYNDYPEFEAVLKDDSTSIDPDSIILVINGISHEISSEYFTPSTGKVLVKSPVELQKGTVEWYFFCRDKVGTPATIEKIIFTKKDRFSMDAAEFYSYPNPFNPLKETVKIRYKVSSDSIVTIKIYDTNGRLVSNVMSEGLRSKGVNTELWDGRNDLGKDISNGVYFAKIIGKNEDMTENTTETLYKKMVILK